MSRVPFEMSKEEADAEFDRLFPSDQPPTNRTRWEAEARARKLVADLRASEREANRQAGAREEREAVVEFLHAKMERHPGAVTRDDLCVWLQHIEDGEHRKEAP